MRVAPKKTLSNVKQAEGGRIGRRSRRHSVLTLLVLVALLAACAPQEYWIPPSSSPTPPPELALLLTPGLPTAVSGSIGGGGLPGESEAQPELNVPATSDPVLPLDTPPALAASPTLADPGAVNPTPVQTINTGPYLYYAQAADTLHAVAVRFSVPAEEISFPDSPAPAHPNALLSPGQLLVIPRRLANTTASHHLLPDSEVVYSPSASDFDIAAFVNQAGGRLSTYREYLKTTGMDTGAEVVLRVALENSINPRVLLSLLEYNSGWVYGQPATKIQEDYPMGLVDASHKGLYHQLVWAVNQLSIGYYSWREGRLTELKFSDGVTARLAPDLNAGSAALQYYFAQLYDGQRWVEVLDPQNGYPALHARMFGNPFDRALKVEPLYPPGLDQPPMILPFRMGDYWSFTGGPHGAWEHDGSYAAIDFAPPSMEAGCVKSNVWVVASASGLVVRSGNGVVVLDLDGDGYEQTGWVLLYLHVSTEGRIPVGSWVDVGTQLGHPSCEGGLSTGTHVHIARKYNGEWIAADGPMPFVLSGWTAHAGAAAYLGTLVRDGQTVEACTCSSAKTRIGRTEDDP